jgi:cyclase
MLRKRVVATLVVQNGIVVQSIGFKKYLPVGRPDIAIEFLDRWGIDEIVLLDISATKSAKGPDYELVKKASLKSHVPLSVGGGITSVDQIKELMHCGADKIVLNQAAINDSDLIEKAAKIFGNQCVVVSIDAISESDGHKVYDYIAAKSLPLAPSDFAKACENFGAGEILINSVDRDGSYRGYDISLIRSICQNVTIPVICSGGARNADDFVKVFSETNASAATAANFFHFTEHSVHITKSNIKKLIDIRLDTHSNYLENPVDDEYRLMKKSDQVLEEMLYIRIEKEVI